MKNTTKFLAILATGASLGILFAPKKGKEFREDLVKSDKKLKAFGGALASASKDATDEVQELVDSIDFKNSLILGKDKMNELIDLMNEHKDELPKKARKTLEIFSKKVRQKSDEHAKFAKKKVKKLFNLF